MAALRRSGRAPSGGRCVRTSGQVAGYTVADYLLQHATRERRSARVPASTWDALLSHLRDPADAARLADSAQGRLLYRYAMPLYRLAVNAGDRDAALLRRGAGPRTVRQRPRESALPPSQARHARRLRSLEANQVARAP